VHRVISVCRFAVDEAPKSATSAETNSKHELDVQHQSTEKVPSVDRSLDSVHSHASAADLMPQAEDSTPKDDDDDDNDVIVADADDDITASEKCRALDELENPNDNSTTESSLNLAHVSGPEGTYGGVQKKTASFDEEPCHSRYKAPVLTQNVAVLYCEGIGGEKTVAESDDFNDVNRVCLVSVEKNDGGDDHEDSVTVQYVRRKPETYPATQKAAGAVETEEQSKSPSTERCLDINSGDATKEIRRCMLSIDTFLRKLRRGSFDVHCSDESTVVEAACRKGEISAEIDSPKAIVLHAKPDTSASREDVLPKYRQEDGANAYTECKPHRPSTNIGKNSKNSPKSSILDAHENSRRHRGDVLAKRRRTHGSEICSNTDISSSVGREVVKEREDVSTKRPWLDDNGNVPADPYLSTLSALRCNGEYPPSSGGRQDLGKRFPAATGALLNGVAVGAETGVKERRDDKSQTDSLSALSKIVLRVVPERVPQNSPPESDIGIVTNSHCCTKSNDQRTRSCAIGRRYLKQATRRGRKRIGGWSGTPQPADWNAPVTLSKFSAREQADVPSAWATTAGNRPPSWLSSVWRNRTAATNRHESPITQKTKKHHESYAVYSCPLCSLEDTDAAARRLERSRYAVEVFRPRAGRCPVCFGHHGW